MAHETRKFLETLPAASPIVRGDFQIPDLDRPLPEARQGGMFGDYELMPLEHQVATAAKICGRRIENMQNNLGSYGMGGYGFFGLDLGGEWLVVPIHLAAMWLVLDGRPFDGPKEKRPWILDGNDQLALERMVGATIINAEFAKDHLKIVLDNEAVISIDADPRSRARFEGTGHPRAFLDSDDLASAVFLSPSPEIYV
ncbi:hypothetical protein [Pacificoceanicola onchidii]|uniref:hypothetical protein n=1 Tax=Pacificoceanicola onchidii TaxID=2562685 RepID=UPI0010A4A5C8|nr:hypothetical protein [Pacificoceanicola onchidii]